MPSDSSSDFKLEIGHVLFIDIVGYSKLSINGISKLFRSSTFTKSARARTNAVSRRMRANQGANPKESKKDEA
jgi:hypothetical protein